MPTVIGTTTHYLFPGGVVYDLTTDTLLRNATINVRNTAGTALTAIGVTSRAAFTLTSNADGFHPPFLLPQIDAVLLQIAVAASGIPAVETRPLAPLLSVLKTIAA